MASVDTRWGYELWNEYDGVLKQVHNNIEQVELIQKFNQERILIEQSYAQKIKKLVRKYSVSKDSGFSAERAVLAYLTEVGNVGIQHERLAANLEASVVKEASFLSGEWRKTHKAHQMEGIRLDKTMKARIQAFETTFKKYKDAHQEMWRAQEAFVKADDDRKLSRAEVDKAKNNAQAKRQEFDRLKAEYAAQREDFNAYQRDHYHHQLPTVFKDLETTDTGVLAKLNGFLYKAGVSESTVANDLMKHYEAISKCADLVKWDEDADLLVAQLKSDAVPPGDRPFVDLDQESPSSSVDNVSNGAGATTGGSFSGKLPGGGLSLKNSTKKDRPGKFLRGLFNGSVAGSGAAGSNFSRHKVVGASQRLSKASQEGDEAVTSPRPDRKQMAGEVEDIEAEIRRTEKQKAALEKLIQMQEQNQKTCDMEQVRAEMVQIQAHLADLQERFARGERGLVRPGQKVSKSRSMPSLHDIKRKARISFRRKKSHADLNGSPGRPGATSSPKRPGDVGNTTDDDDYEFGPREILQHRHDSVSGPAHSLALSGATEDDSFTDHGNGYITPNVQAYCPSVPDQFADDQKTAAPQETTTSYPYIGAAVSLYPFEDNEDPAILPMKAEEQFYVFHRDDDWTYVTRVDGSAKGMVPTSYLSIHMY